MFIYLIYIAHNLQILTNDICLLNYNCLTVFLLSSRRIIFIGIRELFSVNSKLPQSLKFNVDAIIQFKQNFSCWRMTTKKCDVNVCQ